MNEIEVFADYVLKFYSVLCPEYQFTELEVYKALSLQYLLYQETKDSAYEFAGDSFDRERVRDLILDRIRTDSEAIAA